MEFVSLTKLSSHFLVRYPFVLFLFVQQQELGGLYEQQYSDEDDIRGPMEGSTACPGSKCASQTPPAWTMDHTRSATV
jgi:hypothetical protein